MNDNSPIKLLIVDDSLVFCQFLSINLPKLNPKIKVVGYCTRASEALNKIPLLKPDVISLDVEMPQMNGIEFLKKLYPQYKIPVVLVSSLNVNVFDLLSYGAVDFVKKPDLKQQSSVNVFTQNLISKIITAKNAKIKRNTTSTSTLSSNLYQSQNSILSKVTLKLNNPNSIKLKNTIIAIGASTGGTETILEIVKKLPQNTPPIVITQHMPEGFTAMYAERLNRLCAMEVKEAKDKDILKQGRVLLAPGGDFHMVVEQQGSNHVVRLIRGEKVNGHRPSVDMLFNSVASIMKLHKIGIILTGMGCDGAKGLLNMKNNRAFTIGQDRQSSIVYGMPMEAYNLGAVIKQAPHTAISGILINYLNSMS